MGKNSGEQRFGRVANVVPRAGWDPVPIPLLAQRNFMLRDESLSIHGKKPDGELMMNLGIWREGCAMPWGEGARVATRGRR